MAELTDVIEYIQENHSDYLDLLKDPDMALYLGLVNGHTPMDVAVKIIKGIDSIKDKSVEDVAHFTVYTIFSICASFKLFSKIENLDRPDEYNKYAYLQCFTDGHDIETHIPRLTSGQYSKVTYRQISSQFSRLAYIKEAITQIEISYGATLFDIICSVFDKGWKAWPVYFKISRTGKTPSREMVTWSDLKLSFVNTSIRVHKEI